LSQIDIHFKFVIPDKQILACKDLRDPESMGEASAGVAMDSGQQGSQDQNATRSGLA
jgi:hypothetical protein